MMVVLILGFLCLNSLTCQRKALSAFPPLRKSEIKFRAECYLNGSFLYKQQHLSLTLLRPCFLYIISLSLIPPVSLVPQESCLPFSGIHETPTQWSRRVPGRSSSRRFCSSRTTSTRVSWWTPTAPVSLITKYLFCCCCYFIPDRIRCHSVAV